MATPAGSGSARPPVSRGKAILVQMAVVVLLLIGVYLGGLFVGRGQYSALKKEADRRVGEAEAKVEVLSAESRLNLSRSLLHRACAELERRNFGLANSYVKKASDALGGVDAKKAGADPAMVAEVREALSKTNVEVAADLREQQNALTELVIKLDDASPQRR